MLSFLSSVLIHGMIWYGGVGAPVLYPPGFYGNADVSESGKSISEISISADPRHVLSHTSFFWICVGRLLKNSLMVAFSGKIINIY
jgi:hypothetical protein